MACSEAQFVPVHSSGGEPKPALTIETKRLVLRPLASGDLPAMVQLANNFKVSRNLSRLPFPYTMQDGEHWLGMQQGGRLADGGIALAITCQGAYVGGVGLGPVHSAQLELGYWLGEPFWGRGFATEAGQAMIDYGFEMLGLGVIASGHFAENHASGRVLTKLGFRYTVEAMRPCLARGHPVRCLEMAIVRSRWADMRFAKGQDSHAQA